MPEDAIAQAARVTAITFPAKHKITEEPLLFYGGLLQLGDTSVSRSIPKQNIQADILASAIIKIQVFRDGLTTEWDAFCQAPVREIVNMLPTLKLCRGEKCGTDCLHSHAPIGQHLDGAILDLWGRNFSTIEGKRTSDTQAEQSTVFARIPEDFLRTTMELLVPGVFGEGSERATPGLCSGLATWGQSCRCCSSGQDVWKVRWTGPHQDALWNPRAPERRRGSLQSPEARCVFHRCTSISFILCRTALSKALSCEAVGRMGNSARQRARRCYGLDCGHRYTATIGGPSCLWYGCCCYGTPHPEGHHGCDQARHPQEDAAIASTR